MAKKREKKDKSGVSLLEIIAFIAWLVLAGTAGYYFGMPTESDCESVSAAAPQPPPVAAAVAPVDPNKPKCIPNAKSVNVVPNAAAAPQHKHNSLDHLKRQWKCARAELNESHGKVVRTEDNNLVKTKWNTIMSFSPKPFFDRYLAQYPVDTVSHQPVIVFSHKPVHSFDDLTEACKVMDIAVIPDLDDVCIAVTETYHDVASYHMLHAERRADGTFGWHSNNNPAHIVPTEGQYVAARALFGDYFTHMAYVEKEIVQVPRFRGAKTAVASLVEDLEQAELFMNSVASGTRAGISKTKYAVITTSSAVMHKFNGFGVKVIHLSRLETVSRNHPGVNEKMRRNFMLAWLSYACANKQIRVLWQSPGTIWLDRPDNVLAAAPDVETFWVYKGQYDAKAAPFYASFDFAGVGVDDRPIHLMHELILHFELALAWDSFDSMVSYRISENNAR